MISLASGGKKSVDGTAINSEENKADQKSKFDVCEEGEGEEGEEGDEGWDKEDWGGEWDVICGDGEEAEREEKKGERKESEVSGVEMKQEELPKKVLSFS